MPACKNDKTRTYVGTEPSPKGKGWCAHAQTVGDRKRSADGRMWIVCADKNDRRSWKRVPSPSSSKPTVSGRRTKPERRGGSVLDRIPASSVPGGVLTKKAAQKQLDRVSGLVKKVKRALDSDERENTHD